MRLTVNGRFVSQRATGVQRVQRECVRAMDRLVGRGRWPDAEIRLAVPETDNDAHLSLGLVNIAIDVVPGGSGHLWEQRALAKAARGTRLISLGNTSPLLPLLRGRPTAVMIHDLAYRMFPQDYSRAYRVAHAVADAVILRRARPLVTVSETESRNIVAAAHGRPVLVAANGSCGDDVFPDAAPRAAGGPLLYVGAFSSRKNIETVVRVAIAAARRNVPTVLVGPPNDLSRSLEASVPMELRHLVRFAGFVDDAELADLYDRASGLLYVSRYEASGLPPSEAMSHGCPVIASDLPVLRERCGDAALFRAVDDEQGILEDAVRLFHDADLRESLAEAGRAKAISFTWEGQAERVVGALLSEA